MADFSSSPAPVRPEGRPHGSHARKTPAKCAGRIGQTPEGLHLLRARGRDLLLGSQSQWAGCHPRRRWAELSGEKLVTSCFWGGIFWGSSRSRARIMQIDVTMSSMRACPQTSFRRAWFSGPSAWPSERLHRDEGLDWTGVPPPTILIRKQIFLRLF